MHYIIWQHTHTDTMVMHTHSQCDVYQHMVCSLIVVATHNCSGSLHRKEAGKLCLLSWMLALHLTATTIRTYRYDQKQPMLHAVILDPSVEGHIAGNSSRL